ncbi:MAG: glycosyltransferase, partial [Betaproteobacteria bacterium]|nr:glycosyltransferase [Betaproteobacteria bacterium]
NNWTHKGVEKVCQEFEGTGRGLGQTFIIHRHPENLGCAGSWNAGLKAFFDEGFEWAIISNDDIEFKEGSIDAFRKAMEAGADLAYSPSESLACFAIHRRVIDEVGWFDENFWPAYHEDEDFVHRMRIVGRRIVPAEGVELSHARSSTLDYSEYFWFQHRTRLDQQNILYYAKKWGGVPNFEKYSYPFGDHKQPVTYWPEAKKRSWGLRLDEEDRVILDNPKPFKVRLYGSFGNNASFARVSRGLKEGLEELGLLAGAVEVDTVDFEELSTAPGREAPLGLYVGSPSLITVMNSRGSHDMHFAVIAPNSSWMPKKLLQDVRERAAVIAPSTWGADVLKAWGMLEYPPLKHGVSRQFGVIEAARGPLVELYKAGHFRVLHLSSTHLERKGTSQLIRAWRELVADGKLGSDPKLICVVDAPSGTYPEAVGDRTIVLSNQRLDAPERQMAAIYQNCHVVCQPSRGEGFGMVPLEARACGIPVVATASTGHRDHMWPCPPGCVVVETGEDSPIDDGPGAMAPSLTSDAVKEALLTAYQRWLELFDEAGKAATTLHETWGWANQTRIWLGETGLHKEGQ